MIFQFKLDFWDLMEWVPGRVLNSYPGPSCFLTLQVARMLIAHRIQSMLSPPLFCVTLKICRGEWRTAVGFRATIHPIFLIIRTRRLFPIQDTHTGSPVTTLYPAFAYNVRAPESSSWARSTRYWQPHPMQSSSQALSSAVATFRLLFRN